MGLTDPTRSEPRARRAGRVAMRHGPSSRLPRARGLRRTRREATRRGPSSRLPRGRGQRHITLVSSHGTSMGDVGAAATSVRAGALHDRRSSPAPSAIPVVDGAELGPIVVLGRPYGVPTAVLAVGRLDPPVHLSIAVAIRDLDLLARSTLGADRGRGRHSVRIGGHVDAQTVPKVNDPGNTVEWARISSPFSSREIRLTGLRFRFFWPLCEQRLG